MSFDPATLVWYAVICGTLAVVAPNLGSRPLRFGAGALIGLLAASLLSLLKSIMG